MGKLTFLYGKTDLSSSEGHCHTPYCCFVKSGIVFGNFKFNLQSCIHLQAIGQGADGNFYRILF